MTWLQQRVDWSGSIRKGFKIQKTKNSGGRKTSKTIISEGETKEIAAKRAQKKNSIKELVGIVRYVACAIFGEIDVQNELRYFQVLKLEHCIDVEQRFDRDHFVL